MAIKFYILGEYNEEECECEVYTEEYATEEEAKDAWYWLRRAYVRGDSEDKVSSVYFEDENVDLDELAYFFQDYSWEDVISLRDERLKESEEFE